MPRLSRFACLLGLAICSAFAQTPAQPAPSTEQPPAVGTAAPERFFKLFRPYRTDSAAISPDGKLLAYSLREGDDLFVLTVEIDNPAKVRSKVKVGDADTSTPRLQSDVSEKIPARIRWMGWVTDTRLVVETNANLATLVKKDGDSEWTNTSGALFAVNADGTQGRTLVTPKDVEQTKLDPFLPTSNAGQAGNGPTDITVFPGDPSQPSINATIAGYEDAGPNESMLQNRVNNLPLDARTPRSPTFFDYIPDKPEWLLIRTSDSRNYGLYEVNILTSKLKFGPIERTDADLSPLINRQGRLQIALPNTLRTPFPHRYLVQKSGGITLGRWNELNAIAKTPDVDFSVSPQNYLGERSFPIGIDENPDVLYYASNIGRDTYGIYSLNLKTGERIGKPIESSKLDLVSPAPDGFLSENPLVFDRYTRQLAGIRFQGTVRSAIWLRPEIQQVQTELEKAFPGQSVDILGWDKTAARFLSLIQNSTNSGGYYIFDRATNQAMEFVRCAPWTEANEALSLNFSMPTASGGSLSGTLAIPRQVRQKPIPIVVLCADEPWERTTGMFNSEMNALAMMGFAVVQINPRGTWGFGARHRLAAQSAFDEVQIADIVTAIDELAKGMPLNPKRVAILGHDRGGYLAMRAVQLRPDRFRCAVGIEPTVNLAGWLAESRWTSGASAPALTRSFFGEKLLKQNALVDDAKSITRPVFVLGYRGLDGGPTTQYYLDARTFASAVDKPDVPGRFWDLSTDYMQGLPGARSEVMRNIEDFLNENIYAYNVKMGETEVLENAPPQTAPKK
jgi:dipeptidyl aminopeptidase/acylaminoacyl peptidase